MEQRYEKGATKHQENEVAKTALAAVLLPSILSWYFILYTDDKEVKCAHISLHQAGGTMKTYFFSSRLKVLS